MFTAALGLDSKRIASNRPDIVCCVPLPKNEDDYEENHESILFLFMKNCYAPFILHKYMRMLVVGVRGHIDLDSITLIFFRCTFSVLYSLAC